MKRFVLGLILFSAVFMGAALSSEALAMPADFAGYLRGGTGINFEGGQQQCFYNNTLPGNFLRLGNECDFYTELIMVFHHQKPTPQDPVFFRTQVRLVYNSKGTRQWEPAVNRDMSQIEGFVTAGGFSEVPGDWWAGKRFYRDVDLNIFDWYYYADMGGVGAGVENVSMLGGRFSFAHLIQANEDVPNSSVGRPVLQVADLRWNSEHWNFWGAYGWAPRSTQGTTEYVATNGFILASRLHTGLFTGDNQLALLYGTGVLSNFNMYGSSAVLSTDDKQNRAKNWRFVNDWKREVTDTWALMLGLAAEYGENGATTNNRRQFQEIGVRPIYYVSDRFQWVLEAGYSHIKDESEFVGTVPVGDRELGRITIAPQISFSKSIWGRPVLRAFLTHSVWNSNNQASVASKASAYADKTQGTAFGYQFETWF